MPDIQASMQRAGHGVLYLALAQCRAARTTAALRVEGRPGGTFHLRRGGVVAVETSGAPGVEALLLRSGRVRADEWAGAASGMPAAELVARGIVGAAELRVLSAMALQDAVFAVVAGETAGCAAASEAAAVEPTAAGEDPLRLLDGAVRRLAALAALPHAVRPDRERVAATGSALAAVAEGLPPCRREILFLADGRRTARDIAFVVGRGVYPVTVEVSRMLGEGLLRRAGRDGERPGGVPLVRAGLAPVPRRSPMPPPPAVAGAGRRGPAGCGPEPYGGLPRRVPGASGITGDRADGRPATKTLDADDTAASRKGLLRTRGRTPAVRPARPATGPAHHVHVQRGS
ncbi:MULTISPECIES: hypothetical protein [unclassified Streptomyces]|uniref:hypothetical protein n=1 Tax=unclassified Streptomyces TaxID=2593676 RepID=UPI0008DCD4DE|nr:MULTISPECIES: hypothetical protein [unclassified Streptomyces]